MFSRKHRGLIAFVIVVLTGSFLGFGTAKAQPNTFFPVVKPNSYFLMPGAKVGFRAVGFQPGELVSISGNGVSFVARTNSAGAFNTPAMSVGFNGGSQTYLFTGQSSDTSFASTINIADWNPYILLSNYYSNPGTALTIVGHQFGMGEKVDINFGGQNLGAVIANFTGSFSVRVRVPALGSGSQMVTATGESTSKSANQTFIIPGL